MPALRTHIGGASQNIPGHLAFDGQVPLVDGRHLVVAAGIVADSDLIEGRAVSKVRGRRKLAGKARIKTKLGPVAKQRRLGCRILAQGIAEEASARTGTRCANTGSRQDEL